MPSGTLTCILDSGVLDFQMAAVPSRSCALVPAGGQGQAPLVSPHLERMLQRNGPRSFWKSFSLVDNAWLPRVMPGRLVVEW